MTKTSARVCACGKDVRATVCVLDSDPKTLFDCVHTHDKIWRVLTCVRLHFHTSVRVHMRACLFACLCVFV